MKFLVNRVHESSYIKESDAKGLPVQIDVTLCSIFDNDYENLGWVAGCIQFDDGGRYCHGFTIAEIDSDGVMM